MTDDLQPITDIGRHAVALAERHARDFDQRADAHDRAATFPLENTRDLQASGLFAACVPAEFGGLGLHSAYERALILSRIGRGDGSTGIAFAMVLSGQAAFTRFWRRARRHGDHARAATLEAQLRGIAAGEIIDCYPWTEAGTDLFHPRLTAQPHPHGWRINGRKLFATNAPAATRIGASVRIVNPQGGDTWGSIFVPRGTPGMEIPETWDALGMRASGSHDVLFHDCLIPADALLPFDRPLGQWNEYIFDTASFGVWGVAAVFLGIAEAARNHLLATLTAAPKGAAPSDAASPEGGGRPRAARPAVQHGLAQIEIDLAAARAIFERSGRQLDAFLAADDSRDPSDADWHAITKAVQCAKDLITANAVAIVDATLTLSGGAGYLSASPLARYYRDVRAGRFMQPFTPHDARDYIGKLTLGLDPTPAF